MPKYIINNQSEILINDEIILSNNTVVQAINECKIALETMYNNMKDYGINVFEALGMRNLSGFVGEVFVKSIESISNGTLTKNPHQDGYPDLLRTDTYEKKDYYNSIITKENNKIYPRNKDFFSPFRYGGLEVKATCGNTPPASKVAKPLIGESRIEILQSFEWKAHHRETNNLLAILWDFINEIPTIVACFYSNNLTVDDWGKIITPKKDGGRTTSVSIMNSGGVKKLCDNWVALIDDDIYINTLSKKKWIGYNVKETFLNLI